MASHRVRALLAAAAVVLVATSAGCDQMSKPTGVVTRSVGEGSKRYEPLLAELRTAIDPHLGGASWKELPQQPRITNGRCLAIAGEWTASDIPMSNGLPKTVKQAIDPVLTKHGFSASEVMSTDGGVVQLGAVEPGGASFVLKQSKAITLAVYYATTADQCTS